MQRLEFLYLSGNNLDYIPTPLPLSLRVLHLQVPLYTHTYIHGFHLHLWFPNVCSAPFWRRGGSTVTPPPKLTCSQLLLQNCNLSKKKRKKNSQITRGPDPYFGNHWSTWTENFQYFCRQKNCICGSHGWRRRTHAGQPEGQWFDVQLPVCHDPKRWRVSR